MYYHRGIYTYTCTYTHYQQLGVIMIFLLCSPVFILMKNTIKTVTL